MNVTKHANKRIRERMGANKKSVESIAQAALDRGIKHTETTGRLHKYISWLYTSHMSGNNIRIYCQKVFIFHNSSLITVFKLPNEYLKVANKILERKKHANN